MSICPKVVTCIWRLPIPAAGWIRKPEAGSSIRSLRQSSLDAGWGWRPCWASYEVTAEPSGCTSEPGQGTAFKVLFPSSEQEVAAFEQSPEGVEAWRGTGTILIVDDDEGVRLVASKTLE